MPDSEFVQARFITDYLPAHFERCRNYGVRYLAMFGNDDLRCHWDIWRALIDKYGHIDDLSSSWHRLTGGLVLRGCGFVPDVPFRLKDWVAKDTGDSISPPQLARPVVSTSDGLQSIENLEQFLRNRPTLEETFGNFADEVDDDDLRKCILAGTVVTVLIMWLLPEKAP